VQDAAASGGKCGDGVLRQPGQFHHLDGEIGSPWWRQRHREHHEHRQLPMPPYQR
jgi:hypothetical protein